MKTFVHCIFFIGFVLVSFITTTLADDWSTPVLFPFAAGQDIHIEEFWDGYPYAYKKQIWGYIYDINNTRYISRAAQATASPDGYLYSFNSGLSSLTYQSYTLWQGQGNPSYRSFTQTMGGSLFARAAAYNDWVSLYDGLAEAESHSGFGTQIIGSGPGVYGEQHSSSMASVGAKAQNGDDLISFEGGSAFLSTGWPPTFTVSLDYVFVDNNAYEENDKPMLDAVASNAGIFTSWTFYWKFAGVTFKCKAQGARWNGYRAYGSEAYSNVSCCFTPIY